MNEDERRLSLKFEVVRLFGKGFSKKSISKKLLFQNQLSITSSKNTIITIQ
jgi:hypothetical protein